MSTIDTILKIAGAKNMKEFYSLYPSEEAFMEKHGKNFKKAMRGAKIKKAQNGFDMSLLDPVQESPLKLEPWMTDNKTWGAPEETGSWIGNQPDFDKIGKTSSDIMSVMNVGEKFIKAAQAFKEGRNQLQKAKQWRGVTDVMRQAAELPEERIAQKYVRPEDIRMTGEELFPIQGKGTNVLAKKGAKIKKAEKGSNLPYDDITGIANNIVSRITPIEGGEQLGSAVGSAVKMIPGVGAVAEPVLRLVGGFIDRTAENIKKNKQEAESNLGKMAMMQGMQGIFAQNNAYMKDGGDITSLEANGDLRLYDGDASTLSYNPYLPNGGETIIFSGPSHAKGGMDISYGNTNVEVEGGEPAVQLQDGGAVNDSNLTVFGNMTAPGYGKKFKHIVKDIAKKEQKVNKKLDKALSVINDEEFDTPLDTLKYNSAVATMRGSDMKLQEFADEKLKLASLQESINNTAEEMGLVADALAKGKIKKDAKKKSETYAQDGIKLLDEDKRMALEPWMVAKKFGSMGYANNNIQSMIDPDVIKHTNLDEITVVGNKPSEFSRKPISLTYNYPEENMDDLVAIVAERNKNQTDLLQNSVTENVKEEPKKKFNWDELMMGISSYMPYFRPSDAEGLDPRQLLGEMMALGEKEEPVQAQYFQSQLTSPYRVSFQDRANDIVAQTRAAQRMAGDNPAAQALIAGQSYDALNKVRAEEFRVNQALESAMYEQNRKAIDDARLRNIAIGDTQAERQAMAKASTKEIKRKALESISSKYMQNQLENRTLATYENLYNYRFDPRFRATNWNAPAQFNVEGSNIYSPEALRAMADAKEKEEKKSKDSSKTARNGAIVKAMKVL